MRHRVIARSMVAVLWLGTGMMAWAAEATTPAASSTATHRSWRHHSTNKTKTETAPKPSSTTAQMAADTSVKSKTKHTWVHHSK